MEKGLESLGKAEGLGSRAELFRHHTKSVLRSFSPGFEDWTTHSVERYIFDTLLLESGKFNLIFKTFLSVEVY